MCRWCTAAKSNASYTRFLTEMTQADQRRLAATRELQLESVTPQLHSSMEYPVDLIHPYFDARAAYSVPQNYYQHLFIDDERQGVGFAHGSMRSVFFVGDRLVLFSKNVNHMEGKEFFTGFLLLHLERKEFSYDWQGEELSLRVEVTKPLKNLLSGKVERKKIGFTFVHRSLANRIVSKDQIMSSAHLRSVYDKYGGLKGRMASVDIEGYAITVPHFAPHPYLLQVCKEFGYADARAMQEDVLSYFKDHLGH